MQGQPGGAPTEEKGGQDPQRPEPGFLQEHSPPATTFRPGEQPPPGTHTGQEEEETSEQETHNGELLLSFPVKCVCRNGSKAFHFSLNFLNTAPKDTLSLVVLHE